MTSVTDSPGFTAAVEQVTDGTAKLVSLWAMRLLTAQLQAGLDMDPEAAMDDARIAIAEHLEGLAATLRKLRKEGAHAD